MKTFNSENQKNTGENANAKYNGKKGKFASKGKTLGSKKNQDGIKFIANKNKKIVIDENRKNLRRLYNQLMQKDQKKKRPVNKVDIVKKVMKSIDNNYTEFCFKPDGCRVLQGCIKYGDKNQRKELIQHLKPQFYELIVKKYAIYLAIKIFKYSDNKQKEELIVDSLLPNFGKLIKNGNGQLFLNYVFDNVLVKQQNLLCDYYIKKILKVNLDDLNSLKGENTNKNNTHEEIQTPKDPSDPSNDVIILEKQGTYQQDNIKETIKSHIERQLEKGIHKLFCFQAFLNRIFESLDQKTKSYISEVFDDDVNELLTNKSGVELACKLFTVASVKTRKKMIKKIKEHVKSYLSNDSIVLFLIKIILFNDDTKLVEKHILNTLLEALSEEFLTNKSVLKVFCNILNFKHNKINTQQENKILSYNSDSSSKKDDYKRQEEILSASLEEIFKTVHMNLKLCMTDQSYVIIFNDLIDYLISSNNQVKLNEILNDTINVLEFDYKKNYDDFNNLIITDKTGHFAINRIIKSFEIHSNEANDKIKFDFCSKLVKLLMQNVEGFLETKAIFIFTKILENNKTRNLVDKELLKHKNMIKEKIKDEKLTGFQILSKHLS